MSQAQTTTQQRVARGWSGIVAQLTAVADEATFQTLMLDLQCKVVAAEYGALWVAGPDGKPQLLSSWPANMSSDPQQNPVYELLLTSAKGGFERQQSHVLKVAPEGSDEPAGIGAHVFVTALRAGNQLRAVTTVVADCRDPKVLQSTLPLRELGAGLYELFFARQQAQQQAQAAEQVRRAMALLAVSQEGEGFQGAGLNLVNELARQLRCTRVSLGWTHGQAVKLAAMSDTEELKRQADAVVRLESAMSEALDQQQPVVYPVPADGEALLTEAVVYAHRQLAELTPGTQVLSLPLRVQDEWVGALTLERLDEPFPPALVTQLLLVADVVSPHLLDREISDKWLVGHAWDSVCWVASYLVGPRHVGWKLLTLLISALLAACFFVRIPYKVSSEFTIDAEAKRIVPAPYQGDLAEVRVRPGATVQAGQELALLNATEFKLQLAEAVSQLRVQQKQEQKARAERKQAEVQMALANIEQINARIELLQYQLDKAVIRSPIDGVVLTGDWQDKIGGVVEMGKPMFEIAPLEKLDISLRVHERDIDRLQEHLERHGGLPEGTLATRSQPEQKFNFKVRQVVPLAGPVNGENVFEVRASFDSAPWSNTVDYAAGDTVLYEGLRYRAAAASGPSTAIGALAPGTEDARYWQRANWLRPGMEGIARVDADQRTIAWVLVHRMVDLVRLWLWW